VEKLRTLRDIILLCGGTWFINGDHQSTLIQRETCGSGRTFKPTGRHYYIILEKIAGTFNSLFDVPKPNDEAPAVGIASCSWRLATCSAFLELNHVTNHILEGDDPDKT
jgi:hypothetical protein